MYCSNNNRMEVLKFLSRLIISSLFAFAIYIFKFSFFSIICIQTMCIGFLCFYLDFMVPRYNSIIYHEKESSQKYHPRTIGVILNVIINYCLHIYCLWMTMRINVYYDFTYSNIILQYILSLGLSLGSSFLFYYIHKFMHMKYIYGYVHKQHHTYNHPSSYVALYATIPDFILSNCVSIFIPHLILQTHPYFVVGFSFVGVCDIFINHTSYYFENKILDKLFGGSKFHYIHHSQYKYNFGLNNKIFDKIHGTFDPRT